MLKNARLVNTDAAPPTLFGEFKTQAAFSDARFSDNADHSALSVAGILQFAFEALELFGSSNHWIQTSSAAEDAASWSVPTPSQFVDFDRRSQSADGRFTESLCLYELLGCSVCRSRNQDTATLS